MPGGLHVWHLRSRVIINPNLGERHSRSEIGQVVAASRRRGVASQMACGANRFGSTASQLAWMDDRWIGRTNAVGVSFSIRSMFTARPMAAFATNRFFDNSWLGKLTIDRFQSSDVANEATKVRNPLKALVQGPAICR